MPIGTQSFKYHLDGAFFNGDDDKNDVIDSDVAVALTADYRAGGICELRFEFKGEISVPCDRCLDPMPIAIDTTYDLSVKEGTRLDDSTDNLRDTVLLCIPIMHVHADGECNPDMLKALDSHAATSVADEQPDDEEQNDSGMADPRWEALRKLKDNKNN